VFSSAKHSIKTRLKLSNMPKKNEEKAFGRRREIIQMIEEAGYLKIPTQKALAEHFGVTRQQIAKDMRVITSKLPKADPLLTGAQIDKFVDMAIDRLETLRSKADSPRSEREMILATMSLLRQRVELALRLGLIKQAPEKVDTTLHIKWANE